MKEPAIEVTSTVMSKNSPKEWKKEQDSEGDTGRTTSATACDTINEDKTAMRCGCNTTRSSSSSSTEQYNVVEDEDDDEHDDGDEDFTSRKSNTTSNQSKSTSDRSSQHTQLLSPSSAFEINCSPLPTGSNHKSYYEQTRIRHLQQQERDQQQLESIQSEGRTETQSMHQLSPNPIANHSSKILQQWRRPANEQLRKRWQPQPPPIALEEDKESSVEDLMSGAGDLKRSSNHSLDILASEQESVELRKNGNVNDTDDDDDSVYLTLADSDMCCGSNPDDNTISTATNIETNSTSNVSSSMMTGSSDMANSIGSSLSRGGEHISSRLKKYGMVNVYEMKRKQQRRLSRKSSAKSINTSVNLNKSGPASVLSGLTTEGGGASSVAESNLIIDNNENNEHGKPGMEIPTRIRTAPLHVQMAVEEIHRWLFTEGGHFEDVKTLMTQYSIYIREHFGIPLDRLYYGGVGLHPKLTAYLWKWEPNGEFAHSEMPPEVFARRNEIFSPDEPFCVMEQGRADHVRIRDTDSYIPPDTSKWFRPGNYKDYFALPDYHRGFFKGGLAWSTKCDDGFCEDDIQFFRMTHAALTTIMRLHTNDLVLRTLTDRMESEIEDRTVKLAAANRKLEEANSEISRHASKQLEHFACMSHEIRTPLNCIVGLSSLLLENDDLHEELLETINMVYNSADLVQGVVNDVLDYAKIESGHFELDIHPSDLQNTLNGVVHSISNKLRAQEKNVEIRTSYCARLAKNMTTDSRRLQQILYNILGNAAKFSKEGKTIDFKVQIIAVSNDDTNGDKQPSNKIRFSIKDYGKGIEEENFEKIFQPFSQASKETQTIYGGTGLGLSITKNLVIRLGGTISIKSEIDKYTEFIVELPYEDELFDPSACKEKMSETSIVILDPAADRGGELSTPFGDDDFDPFRKEISRQYDLHVLRCASWGELESKLGLRTNIRERYIFLAHEDIDENQGVMNVESIVGRDRCSWFTYGSDSLLTQQQRHFKSLTAIFPSCLVQKLVDFMDVDRANLDPFNSSMNSKMSVVSAGSASECEGRRDDAQMLSSEEIGRWNPKRAVSPESVGSDPMELASIASLQNNDQHPTIITSAPPESVTSHRNVVSKSLPTEPTASPSIPNKKFATKYPKRDLKVLVVDDNVINQKVLDRILRRLGVSNISIVNNGKKAVDISGKDTFDCIFMDMEMPVMGGLEACRLIVDRDKEAARVAFVTAHDIGDIREKADAAGAFGYISKPLKLQGIHKFLTTIEDIKKREDASPSVESTKTTTKTKPQVTRKERPVPPKKKRCTKVYPTRNLKVLVAEDNLINQKVLHRILKRLGATDVTMVDNGKKAVDASASTKFDCILMDMQMPIMDGLEACKIIVKRDEYQEDPPKVVFVTAHALVEFKEKALAAGGFDFITKPFKMEDIDKILTTLETMKNDDTERSKSSAPVPSEGETVEEHSVRSTSMNPA